MRYVFLFSLFFAAPLVWAQYNVDPTHLYPAASNTAPGKKTPPKNKVISTTDKRKAAIPMHKADRYYPINQSKPMSITSNNQRSKPVTVWKGVKKPAYSSLYQDPSATQ